MSLAYNGMSFLCVCSSLRWLTSVILSGWIRGIVQLEILSEIEKAIGGGIPIQEFFELMVGTK